MVRRRLTKAPATGAPCNIRYMRHQVNQKSAHRLSNRQEIPIKWDPVPGPDWWDPELYGDEELPDDDDDDDDDDDGDRGF